MMKVIRILLLTLILSAVACGVSAASSLPSGAKGPDTSETATIIPNTDSFKSPDPTYYAWETDGILGSAIGYLANLGMSGAAFLLKISIVTLDFGLHPTWMDSTIEKITKTALGNGWVFVQLLWPFIILGAFILFAKDYAGGSYSMMLKRGTNMLIVLAVMGVLFAVPSTAVTKALSATTEFSTWISGKFLAIYSADGAAADQSTQNSYIYQSVWDQLIDRSMSFGEFGSENITIDAESAEKINSKIKPYSVVAGMRWVDGALMFAPDSDERADIIDIFADKHEEQYDQAKNVYWRLSVSYLSLTSSLWASLFLIGMGIIMIILMIWFVGMILASIVMLPLAAIPTKEPVMLLGFVQKFLGVFVSMIFVFSYIALVFVVNDFVLKIEDLHYLYRMSLPSIVFIIGFIMFFVLLSKLGKVPALKQMNEVMAPLNHAGKQVGRGVKRYARRKGREHRYNQRRKNKKKKYGPYDDDAYDEEYDPEDEENEYDPDGEYDDPDEFYEDDDEDEDGEPRRHRRTRRDPDVEDDNHQEAEKKGRSRSKTRKGWEDSGPTSDDPNDPDFVPAVLPGSANQQSLWGTAPPPRKQEQGPEPAAEEKDSDSTEYDQPELPIDDSSISLSKTAAADAANIAVVPVQADALPVEDAGERIWQEMKQANMEKRFEEERLISQESGILRHDNDFTDDMAPPVEEPNEDPRTEGRSPEVSKITERPEGQTPDQTDNHTESQPAASITTQDNAVDGAAGSTRPFENDNVIRMPIRPKQPDNEPEDRITDIDMSEEVYSNNEDSSADHPEPTAAEPLQNNKESYIADQQGSEEKPIAPISRDIITEPSASTNAAQPAFIDSSPAGQSDRAAIQQMTESKKAGKLTRRAPRFDENPSAGSTQPTEETEQPKIDPDESNN